MRQTLYVAWVVFGVFLGTIALSGDVDLQALQAKLAAQEASLSDFEAKLRDRTSGKGSTPKTIEGATSLRKNATVTIGGMIASGYLYTQGYVDSKYSGPKTQTDSSGKKVPVLDANGRPLLDYADSDTQRRVRTNDIRDASLTVKDAKLEIKVDINDNFDAFFKFDMQEGQSFRGANVAEQSWVRWKNICNSGWGILVGRDDLKFGATAPFGNWDTWEAAITDMSENLFSDLWFDDSNASFGMSTLNGAPARPTLSSTTRTTQITPYWENRDGTFKWELSFFQLPETAVNSFADYKRGNTNYFRGVSYGLGSIASRITWQPIKDLTFTGSVMNIHAKHRAGGLWEYPNGEEFDTDNWVETSGNNFATHIGFEYRPVFLKRVNLYASWTHGWNDGWVKDQSSDSISSGFSVDVTDRIVFYALGDHMRSKSKQGRDSYLYKATGWASEIGVNYTNSSYGFRFDLAWRHERLTYENGAGDKHTRLTGDGVIGSVTLGF